MTDEIIQSYNFRISRANRSELTVIIFDIALEYAEEALNPEGNFERSISKIAECIETLKNTLDFTYELAGTLLHLYIRMKKQLYKALFSEKKEDVEPVKYALISLREAFDTVSREDNSAPLYSNIEDVAAGYTYGRDDININPSSASGNRGFFA